MLIFVDGQQLIDGSNLDEPLSETASLYIVKRSRGLRVQDSTSTNFSLTPWTIPRGEVSSPTIFLENLSMKRPALALATSLALSVAGCGSVTGIDDLFSGATGAGGAAATTTGAGGAPGVTTAGVGGASTTGSSGPTTSGVTSSASGPVTTGSTATSTTAVSSSVSGPGSTTAASSSSGGPLNTVFCNNAECAPGEICCFNLSQQTDHCGQAGSCGDGFIDLECNGPEDCPGGVCCGDVDFQNNPPYKGVACKQSCNDPQNQIIICSEADPTCPPGKQCKPSMFLGKGYKICN